MKVVRWTGARQMVYSRCAMTSPEIPESPSFFGISAVRQRRSERLMMLNILSDSPDLYPFLGA
jgi:hypothetical protein